MSAAASQAQREGRFPDPNAPLDDRARATLKTFRIDGPRTQMCRTSPERAARETAMLLGIEGDPVAALRDVDAGAWRGRSLREVEEDALKQWLSAPGSAAPGGECLADVAHRVGVWMDGLDPGHWLAITHAAVLRAAIVYGLDMPISVACAIDIAPLTCVVLSLHGRWRLQEIRRT